MDSNYIIYPFIFIGLYFEVFLLVTFLSTPARVRRARGPSSATPLVAMIVPCWNEETTVAGTVDSLLALDYPKDRLRIILVNDGSTDGTGAVMDTYAGNPQITVIHQKNGGKHTAVNAGIAAAPEAEFIGCMDADSFAAPDALRHIIGCFDDPKVAAATAAMSVDNPSDWLERMQHAEYVLGIALRHILSALNGIHVTPGPFSLYRRTVLEELGGFRFGHQTEDMEMALRMQRAGYEIENAPLARVYTKTPRTIPKLIKQRTRWTSGFLRNVSYDYRDMVGNPKYGTLGLLVLPLGFLAITGGVILFGIAIFELGKNLIQAVILTNGVPLSYIFRIQFFSFEWYYLPITMLLLLSIVVTVGIFTFMIIGKTVSKTPGKLGSGIITYVLLYQLIAPFWLVRSLFDVLTGHKRSWR